MPRQFKDTAMQAGWTAFEFSEGIETNYFMTLENRDKFDKGWKAADHAAIVTIEYAKRRAASRARSVAILAGLPPAKHKKARVHPAGW